MTSESSRSGKEQIQFDETIFKPRTNSRVRLPDEQEVVYQEEQPFDQVWLWVLMGLEIVVTGISLLSASQPLWTMAIAGAVLVSTMAMLGWLKLCTRIDQDGVHYRMKPFHLKERTILWDDIDQIYVRKYSPIAEYGGWGIRYGRFGRALNVKGTYGIQIIKKDGKRLLLGTQRPDEVAEQLGRHPLLV